MNLRAVLVSLLGTGFVLCCCRAQPLKILVERSGPHSGSYWLGELFSAQNVKTFWQFYGDCGPPYGDLAALDADAIKERQLEDLLDRGCNCPDMPMFQQCLQFKNRTSGAVEPGCGRAPFCQRSCPGPPGSGCDSIAVVGDIVPTSRSDVVYVMFHRGNSVKQAVSMLKAKCTGAAERTKASKQLQLGGAFSNHPHDAEPRKGYLFVEGMNHFHQVVRNANAKRVDMVQRGKDLVSENRRVIEIHYEDVQRDIATAFQRIFEAIGLARPEIQTETDAKLVKPSSRDDLAETVLNFDQLNSSLSEEPCFQRQLNAVGPEHFPTCDHASTFGIRDPRRSFDASTITQLPVFVDCNLRICSPSDCGQGSNFEASGEAIICAGAAWRAGIRGDQEIPDICKI
mmetsp:Transcript_7774/g.23761  ORF Transcript_7774/g.23761 Transcript_7774/m.23761 type:complete len:398 (-) Transcript_7774:434-1627(-)